MAVKGLFFVPILRKGGRMEDLKKVCAGINFSPKVELVEKDGKEKLYLYGSIVDEIPTDWWTGDEIPGEYIMIDDVKDAFSKAKGDEIEIHLNSKGGDVYASVAIGNYIKDSGKKVTIIVDAIAASGGSIIAMAADNIKMYPNSLMMIHRASAMTYGNCEELRKIADDLEKFDKAVLASYQGHFKGNVDELEKLIKDETYLTAEECVTLGFADEIIEKPKEEAETEKVDIKNSLLEKYKITAQEKKKEKVKNNLISKFKKGDKI